MSLQRRRSGQVTGVGVDDVVKALKVHLDLESVLADPSKSLFVNQPAEEALQKHHKLVDYLEELTGNPRKTLLQSALKELNRWAGGRLGDDDEEEWSRKESYALKQLFIHVREKSHRYTTGVRTHPAVLGLLERHRQRQMQGRMLRGTRRLLHRRSSDPAEPPAAPAALQASQVELRSVRAATTPGSVSGSATCPAAAATSRPARRPTTSADASSSARQKPLSRSDIFALYGAVPPNDSEVVTVESSAELLGSQDDATEVSHNPPTAKQREHKTYYDPHLDTVVRAYTDGSLEHGTTHKGPRGFLVGHFPDGTTWESEIPNLTQELPQAPPQQPPAKRRRRKGTPKEAPPAQGLPPPAQGSGPSADSASSEAAPPRFRITRAAAQTYICRQEGKQWPLVVAVSAKQTSAHLAVGEALRAHVLANSYTKPQLYALRDALIQQHSPTS